jgi:hypothetical protein
MANHPMASGVLELFAQEDKAYFFRAEEARLFTPSEGVARVYRGGHDPDRLTHNQVVWGVDLWNDVMLLASKGSPDAANLEAFLKREGLTAKKLSGSFEYYNIPKDAVAAKLKQRVPKPKIEAPKDAVEAKLEQRIPKTEASGFSFWNSLKQLYGKVDKQYGFMLNHADEVKNVKDNYYYIRRRKGWLYDRTNRSERYTAFSFSNRDAAELLLLDNEIRQHAKNSDKAFYLHTELSGQVGLLYSPNYGVDKDYYFIKKEDVDKVAELRDDGSGDFSYSSREALRELVSGCYDYRKLRP